MYEYCEDPVEGIVPVMDSDWSASRDDADMVGVDGGVSCDDTVIVLDAVEKMPS